MAATPYSNFDVGAALRTDSGNIYTGCNIEVANYSNTLHAEEVAVAEAVKNGDTDFDTLVVTTESGAAPCGMCRQTLSEFDDGSLRIILDDGKETYERTLRELLPDVFSDEDILD